MASVIEKQKKKHKPNFIKKKILSVGVVDKSQSTILCCLIITGILVVAQS